MDEKTLGILYTKAADVGQKLIGVIIVFIVGRIVIGWMKKLIARSLKARSVEATLISYADSVASVLFNILLALVMLGMCGIETTTFAGLLAAAGLAIGTAWGGLLANFAAGAFLIVLRPFKKGDFVTVSGGVTGTVEEVGLFTTVIHTMDNVKTIVGNNKVFGDTIQNFRFLGYPKSAKDGGLKTVALVDYFNPDGANSNFKLIHIQAAGSWCVYCRNEQDMITPKMGEIEGKGVVWLTAMVEGAKQGSPAELTDIDSWLLRHKTTNTVVIDSANQNLGVFFRQAALPWNGWVDARTMEILTYQEGAPPNYDALASEMNDWLGYIDSHPVGQ